MTEAQDQVNAFIAVYLAISKDSELNWRLDGNEEYMQPIEELIEELSDSSDDTISTENKIALTFLRKCKKANVTDVILAKDD